MIYAVANQKGGIGKTATAAALISGLTLKGYTVLGVDLDAQGNLSDELRVKGLKPSILDVMTGHTAVQDAIRQIDDKRYFIPSSPFLASADIAFTETGKEYRLKEVLQPVKRNYDYIIIDTPPAVGVLTINALTAADSVIIPTAAEKHATDGIAEIYRTITTVRKYTNQGLTIAGILFTRFKARSILTRTFLPMLEDSARAINTRVFNTKIRECQIIAEAAATQTDIYSYAPKSNAATDYTALITELIGG